ncbi:hypothetical protein Fcan01_15865 [Folsomia candida]|uniref:Uncharacterized protein n=1 Tax=Folsomia candida TaxID=158441 RepID=A0A226E040_FOLCA|nr:hypothetical protein Fcan01_15865 [Folsomia candida]
MSRIIEFLSPFLILFVRNHVQAAPFQEVSAHGFNPFYSGEGYHAPNLFFGPDIFDVVFVSYHETTFKSTFYASLPLPYIILEAKNIYKVWRTNSIQAMETLVTNLEIGSDKYRIGSDRIGFARFRMGSAPGSTRNPMRSDPRIGSIVGYPRMIQLDMFRISDEIRGISLTKFCSHCASFSRIIFHSIAPKCTSNMMNHCISKVTLNFARSVRNESNIFVLVHIQQGNTIFCKRDTRKYDPVDFLNINFHGSLNAHTLPEIIAFEALQPYRERVNCYCLVLNTTPGKIHVKILIQLDSPYPGEGQGLWPGSDKRSWSFITCDGVSQGYAYSAYLKIFLHKIQAIQGGPNDMETTTLLCGRPDRSVADLSRWQPDGHALVTNIVSTLNSLDTSPHTLRSWLIILLTAGGVALFFMVITHQGRVKNGDMLRVKLPAIMFVIIPPLISVGVAANRLNFLCDKKDWHKAQLILFLWLFSCIILSNAFIGTVITSVIAPPAAVPKWNTFEEIEAAKFTRIVIPEDNKEYFKKHTPVEMLIGTGLSQYWYVEWHKRWIKEYEKLGGVCTPTIRQEEHAGLCKHVWDSFDELIALQKLGNYNDAAGLLENLSTCNRSALFDFSNRISALLPILNDISDSQTYTKGRQFGEQNYFKIFKGLSVLRKWMTPRLQIMWSSGIFARWAEICERFCYEVQRPTTREFSQNRQRNSNCYSWGVMHAILIKKWKAEMGGTFKVVIFLVATLTLATAISQDGLKPTDFVYLCDEACQKPGNLHNEAVRKCCKNLGYKSNGYCKANDRAYCIR